MDKTIPPVIGKSNINYNHNKCDPYIHVAYGHGCELTKKIYPLHKEPSVMDIFINGLKSIILKFTR